MKIIKTNNAFYFTIILIIGILILVKFYNLINELEAKEKKIDILDKSVITSNEVIKSSNERNLLRSMFTNTRIRNIKLFAENKDSLLLNSIIGEYKVLFLYNNLGCQDCISREIQNLKEIGKLIGEDNILILATYFNQRDLFIFKRVNDLIKINVFKTNENPLHLITKSITTPCFLIIDNNLKIRELYLTDVDEPDESLKNYHALISKYYNQNQFKS
jgi:hypothetical protein